MDFSTMDSLAMSFYECEGAGSTAADNKHLQDATANNTGLIDTGDLFDLPDFELSCDIQQLLSQSSTPPQTHQHSVGELFPELTFNGTSLGTSEKPAEHCKAATTNNDHDTYTLEQTSLDHHHQETAVPDCIVEDFMPHITYKLVEIPSEEADEGASKIVFATSCKEEEFGAEPEDQATNLTQGEELVFPYPVEAIHWQAASEVEIKVEEPVTSTSTTRPATGQRDALKATPPSKTTARAASRKKSLAKDSEEYRDKRDRNNVAVRRSREKSKQKQKETDQKVHDLTTENERLQMKVDLLTKELNVLRGLFNKIGAAMPKEFNEYVQKMQ